MTSKTQIKEKVLNVKTLGYLPRVLFFNAFELGSVVLEDAHIRNMNGSKKSIKEQM
jgi:hypothetical protein